MLDLTAFPAISWPKFRRVKQFLEGQKEPDPANAVRREIEKVDQFVHAGKTYAIGLGSRGIANLKPIAQAAIQEIRKLGANVVIVPAMASHGGATPEGQKEVLSSFGITEESMGVPIDARMDTTIIAQLNDGTPVHFSQAALDTDGVIPINRVKLHTAFRGSIESGLTKMLVIGFGKQRGAATIHSRGFSMFHQVIPEAGRLILDRVTVPFGLAIVENGFDETALIRAVASNRILQTEPELLELSRKLMARLPFSSIDVLVVGQLGKNISGDGMDPNVTGRYGSDAAQGGPHIQKVAVLNLTKETHGNANGVGLADTIPYHAFQEIDWVKTYTNALTSTEFRPIKAPMVAKNDHDAIEIALRTLNGRSPEDARMVVIRNTLELEYMAISQPLEEEAKALGLQWLSPLQDIIFDQDGNLPDALGIPLRD